MKKQTMAMMLALALAMTAMITASAEEAAVINPVAGQETTTLDAAPDEMKSVEIPEADTLETKDVETPKVAAFRGTLVYTVERQPVEIALTVEAEWAADGSVNRLTGLDAVSTDTAVQVEDARFTFVPGASDASAHLHLDIPLMVNGETQWLSDSLSLSIQDGALVVKPEVARLK
ncbi:hypothetical protein LJC74_04720 [Eubacteriales bacterium OttesenSCG-928-A19]|nr:hypothetical protein [Eubacteriales bacterium OttesenSCG-928-A19]